MEDTLIQKKKIISYLTFQLGGENFALNVGKIRNILEVPRITRVPQMPEFVKGIINLRGEVLPVIDTRQKLGWDEIQMTDFTCILVIETVIAENNVHFGLLVESVQGVHEFEDEFIQEPPGINKNQDDSYITGVVKHDDAFIMILDINKIMDKDEVIVLNTIKNHQGLN